MNFASGEKIDPEFNRRSIARGKQLGLVEVFNDGSWTLTERYCNFLDSIPQQLERSDLADVKKAVHNMPNSMNILGYFTVAYLKRDGFMTNYEADFDPEFGQLLKILDYYLWGPRFQKNLK